VPAGADGRTKLPQMRQPVAIARAVAERAKSESRDLSEGTRRFVEEYSAYVGQAGS
jgi:hypothetical protein